ncbi:DNA-directed RNA polymerase III subunit rpc3 [Rasamsonia emersonii CBS 393.64]|uniref:DNA-directed RNA polymerase III subunit RPC3 n=1 Tax=Rasamsonia emersonii (strain ATCC 16479 / CBS 393.64 / IMI 116815) TaxID=1408163 RepID=A0A0F4YX64_RASE3|nr:DNA-directed RNA polymerase III subunit rpc3 [Rasamsonia emersonii CBS 393.64]KKA22203.1 DNA-directed RNA polymerase III subunit rpc3 [Rasamsonia emersonii CBS 393.64]
MLLTCFREIPKLQFAIRIFSTLVRYDRLALPRLKFYSRLSDKQLHYGLSAMIQMHLVFHYTSYDDGVTYYEANTQSAYYLIRSGKILEVVANRLGEYAATVLSTIMYLGHAQVSYLETLPELLSEQPKETQTNGVSSDHEHSDQDEGVEKEDGDDAEKHTSIPNGDHASNEESRLRLHSTLKALAAHGYIIRVRDAHFQSHADIVMDAERSIKSRPDMKGLKGKKLDEALVEAVERLVKERTDGDLTRGLMFKGIPRGVKRRHANGIANGSNKRPRLEPSVAHAVAEDDSEEDDWSDDDVVEDTSDLIVRVNYEKLDVVFRNRRLVELAEQYSSAVTAQVYETLLRLIEYQTPRCRDQPEIPPEGEEGERYSVAIPLHTLAEEVDPQLDLAGSIGPMDPSQPPGRRGKRPLENGVNGDGEDEPDGALKGNRTHDIDQHLTLLAQPPYNFCSRRLSSGIPSWTVEYRHLARHLRHLEIERIVGTRYGSAALRVIRILLAKGKLDEKRLQEISLLSSKDLRQVLGGMQATGFVDLQEVPRDAQRQPSRTIYLWFYDPDRVCRNLLQDTYKAMSRCLQRIRFERNRLREFLDKTERSDVKGNEERYLSEAELKTLQQWRDKEALLLGEVSRLDDLVAVLRDF